MNKKKSSNLKEETRLDTSPPSPFKNGWKSVNAADYPYPIPLPTTTTTTTQEEQEETHVNLNDANRKENKPNPKQNKVVHKDKLNTKALFIPKPKLSIRKKNSLTTASVLDPKNNLQHVESPDHNSIHPDINHLDSQNHLNKDSFSDWGSPQEEEINVQENGRNEEEETRQKENDQHETRQENTINEMKEIEKPLKLDKNLLEIIIRTIFVQIKLIESISNHTELLAVLNHYKNQTRGLHKTHSLIFEKKLTEAVDRMRVIQLEYDRVSNTIDLDLKSYIENSVSHHRKILNAPSVSLNGLFSDDWSPKPVTYLDSITLPSLNNPIDHLDSISHQPATSSLNSNLRKEPIQSLNNNSNNVDNPWGWEDDTAENTIVNLNPTNESINKSTECPWGADEPEDITNKSNQAQTESTENQQDSFGWGASNDNNPNLNVESSNNEKSSWSNQNFENDANSFNFDNNSNAFNNNLENNNNFEFRPRDSGWGGRGNSRGGGGFFNDQSGFRGRGRGFGGDRGRGFGGDRGFRARGGGEGGRYGGRSRGFGGGGFGGRGRGFGNNNDFSSGGGNFNGFGDGDSNNNWNNNAGDTFNGANDNGFRETGHGFNGGFNQNDNNRFKGGWDDSQNVGSNNNGNDQSGGWGDENAPQGGLSNFEGNTKGGFSTESSNNFKSGWDDSANDFGGGFNKGGGGRDLQTAARGNGFRTTESSKVFQVPELPSNRPIIQYDNITANDENDASVNLNDSSIIIQPSQLNTSEDKRVEDKSKNEENGKDVDFGWGSPPLDVQVEISSATTTKNFVDFDEAPMRDDLPVKLDYGGDMLIDKTNQISNHVQIDKINQKNQSVQEDKEN